MISILSKETFPFGKAGGLDSDVSEELAGPTGAEEEDEAAAAEVDLDDPVLDVVPSIGVEVDLDAPILLVDFSTEIKPEVDVDESCSADPLTATACPVRSCLTISRPCVTQSS